MGMRMWKGIVNQHHRAVLRTIHKVTVMKIQGIILDNRYCMLSTKAYIFLLSITHSSSQKHEKYVRIMCKDSMCMYRGICTIHVIFKQFVCFFVTAKQYVGGLDYQGDGIKVAVGS
jgi:hypothetical protein